MPFHYVRDDVARRVRLTPLDPMTVDDMIQTVDRQLAEGAWKYAAIVDLRRITTPASAAELRAFMEHFRRLVALQGPRGPLVVVARAIGAIASAQIYSSVGGTDNREFEVFWDMDDAEEWLDQRSPPQ